MSLNRNQWITLGVLSLIVLSTFISAALLHHRIEYSKSGSLGLHNLHQPVRTLVIDEHWEINLFVGDDSKHRNAYRTPFREGDFLDTLTNRSVEIFRPTGTAGLFEQYVYQRGDTLFFKQPNTATPLQARLNLSTSENLMIINRGELKAFTFPTKASPLPVQHLNLRLSGASFTAWIGAEPQTLCVNATNHAALNFVVRHANEPTLARRFTVRATDRSIIRVRGLDVSPEQVSTSLSGEAALVVNDEYTAVASDRLAHR